MADLLTEEKTFQEMDTDELRDTIQRLADQNEYLEESMTDLALRIDDMGWKPLGQYGGEHEIPLSSLQEMADTCQALVTMNPQVKRGIAARTSYIWGQGVIVGDKGDAWFTKSVQRTFGTTVAQLEIERTAAATGNLFFLVDSARNYVRRIPFHEIGAVMCDPDDPETVLYVKRTYNRRAIDLDRGNPVADNPEEVWYPTDQLESLPVGSIQRVRVDRTQRIVHIPFNRQVGWAMGVPDVFAVVFWAKAYKEFLENCATLARAYARFAAKVTSSSKKGQQRVASKMAEAPARDPATGQVREVGATAALGSGHDLSFMQTVRPVEFDAGSPLAAMVAAGLEVPLPVLTSDPGTGNRATAETLDDPTILSMQARQQLMDDGLKRIIALLGGDDTRTIEWPPLADEPMHRKVQAADQAGRTGMLHPAEWRKLVLDAVNVKDENLPNQPPGEDELPEILKQENEPPAQTDPPSRGNHELRDEGGQAHTEE